MLEAEVVQTPGFLKTLGSFAVIYAPSLQG